MRKFIIDTDTGSDDAAAIMLAAAAKDIEILGVTTVCGNVPLEQATRNALQTLETAGCDAVVYPGAAHPLYRPLITAEGVHGKDGMGGRDLVHPARTPSDKHAVDFILETVAAHPGETEIVMLGPATNIALALMREPETMKKVKHIWSMGTAGFGAGNTSPVAEFNVYADADSYAMLLESGIPLTVIGFDLCLGPAALDREDLAEMAAGGPMSRLAEECTKALLEFNLKKGSGHIVDLPDAVAMAAALWPEMVKEKVEAYCYCCTKEEPAYGQVIIFDVSVSMPIAFQVPPANASVVRTIDTEMFRSRLKQALITGSI